MQFGYLVQLIHIAVVAPGICKSLLLRIGIIAVNTFKQHILVGLAIKGRVNIDKVDKWLRVIPAYFFHYVKAVAKVQVVHRLG